MNKPLQASPQALGSCPVLLLRAANQPWALPWLPTASLLLGGMG